MTGEDAQRSGQSDEEEKDNDREEETQGMWYMHHYHWKCTTTIHQGEKKINVKSHSLSFLCPLDYIELSKNIQRTNANIIYLFKLIIRQT